MKILRSARDHIVCTCICVILKGAAGRLHARSARRWGSLGSCPKRVGFRHGGPVLFGVVPERVVDLWHEGPVLFGVVPERGLFWARVWPRFALTSPSVQSEEGYLQRCRKVQFNFAAPQSEIGVIWQKSTEVRKE